MEACIGRNPGGRHGKYTYALEDCGLTREQIRERCRDCCDRFRIPENP